MIHVARNSVKPPLDLKSSFVSRSLAAADEFYQRPARARRQRRFELSLEAIHEPVADTLARLFHGKCAYCETLVDRRTSTCIDHYRPRRNTLGQDGETYLDHYWWLAFKWDNLLFSCPECSRMRGNRFPIIGPRAEILAETESLNAELPLLLHPCVDWPEDHLDFQPDGPVIPLTERGKISAEMMGLNRPGLIEQRRAVASQLQAELGQKSELKTAALPQLLRTWLVPELPFLGLRRAIIRRWLENRLKPSEGDGLRSLLIELFVVPAWMPVLRRPLRVPEPIKFKDPESAEWQAKRAYYSQLRTIQKVEIANFKGISSLMIEAPQSSSASEPWVMFLGENGTGKSSVLQAIALALLGQHACDGLKLDGREFVRRGASEGSVRVWLSNTPSPVELKFNAQRRRFRVTPPAPALLLLGFGATRLLPRSRHKQKPALRGNRVKNLFDPFARLNHAERWLTDRRAVNDDRFNRIAVALKKLLLLADEHQFNRDADRVWVKLHGPKVTLSELSDGYQSIVVMAVNIIMGVVDRWKEIELAEGVVLVDELEVHLHPLWKMEIVNRLRQAFPKMTFLVTTHDPLCLRGLNPGEIIVLKQAKAGIEPTVVRESIAHLRADQLLTSPLFGLLGTREVSTTEALTALGKRYDELFIKNMRSPEEEAELQDLRAQIVSKTPTGETAAARYVEEAVRKTVQELVITPPPASATTPMPASAELRAAIKSKITNLLNEETYA